MSIYERASRAATAGMFGRRPVHEAATKGRLRTRPWAAPGEVNRDRDRGIRAFCFPPSGGASRGQSIYKRFHDILDSLICAWARLRAGCTLFAGREEKTPTGEGVQLQVEILILFLFRGSQGEGERVPKREEGGWWVSLEAKYLVARSRLEWKALFNHRS